MHYLPTYLLTYLPTYLTVVTVVTVGTVVKETSSDKNHATSPQRKIMQTLFFCIMYYLPTNLSDSSDCSDSSDRRDINE